MIRSTRKVRLRRGESLCIVTSKNGACEVHPVRPSVNDGPTEIRPGLAPVLDRNTSYDSERFGTVYIVSSEEARSIRYEGEAGWKGPTASRVARAILDIRAKDVARVEPEGLFGFLTKAMPLMMLLTVLMMGWMVFQGISG